MFLENVTDENIYCMILGMDEKFFIPPREIIEIECPVDLIFKLYHSTSSNYQIEKFTKSPKCTIRINSTYTICNVDATTRIVIEKCEHFIDYIFSYVSHCCSINIGEITDIEYDIIDSELLIEKHKKHLKKDKNYEYFFLPFAFIDVGLTIFIWKWCGLKEAMIVLLLGLIFCSLVNTVIVLLFSSSKKDEKEYLKYFTSDYVKIFLSN